MLGFTCGTWNAYRDWSCEADLGWKYSRIQNQIPSFREISIDPLGPVLVKAFPGSRKKVKCYPLISKCLNSAAIQIMLTENMETRQVVLALLRIKTRYGEIKLIARDSETNLLEGNLNPKVDSSD